MRMALILIGMLLALPAHAEDYPAADCREIARLGEALVDKSVAIRQGKAPDLELFWLVQKDLRHWLNSHCYADCDEYLEDSSLSDMDKDCIRIQDDKR